MSEEAYAIRKNLTDAEKGKVQVRQVRHTDDHNAGGGGLGGGGGGQTIPLAHTQTSASAQRPYQQGPFSFYSIDSYGASGQSHQPESQSQFPIQGQVQGQVQTTSQLPIRNLVGPGSVQQVLPYSQLPRNTYNQQQQQHQQHPYISASPYGQKVNTSAAYQSMQIAERHVDESDPLEFMQ